jgi:hypothetical protein
VEARIAGGVLEDADQEELAGLVEELGGLPATDGWLRWPLPRLWTPNLTSWPRRWHLAKVAFEQYRLRRWA